MGKHGQKIVFGAVGCFHCRFLFLERRFSPATLRHSGSERECRNGEHGCSRLQNEERLILRCQYKRSSALASSPYSNGSEHKYPCRLFARGKSKCQPNHKWTVQKRNRIISRADGKPSTKANFGQKNQGQEKDAYLGDLPSRPFSR